MGRRSDGFDVLNYFINMYYYILYMYMDIILYGITVTSFILFCLYLFHYIFIVLHLMLHCIINYMERTWKAGSSLQSAQQLIRLILVPYGHPD